jgi:8-amino-7-oxononanoate synthase
MAQAKLQELDQQNLLRSLQETGRDEACNVIRAGQNLISFCCNDYLGLSQHPDVKDAAVNAVLEYGVGAGASRLVTGNHPLYEQLESLLANIKGTEAALVFGSGYLANLGVPPVIAGRNDLIIADELSHASMRAGIRASTADSVFFMHNDILDCRAILKQKRHKYKNCLLMTEGVFSMDGDLAPLVDLCNLAEEFDSIILTDDAHGFGVLGQGRGSAAELGVSDRISLQMGTLSKSVGVYGGFICASRAVIDLLVNRGRSLIYATGLPPSVVAAAVASLKIIQTNKKLTNLPILNARRFARRLGLPDADSPIIPIVTKTSNKALESSQKLMDEGFLVTAIRPPTVPEGTARLRFTFSAQHRKEEIDRLAATVLKIGLL